MILVSFLQWTGREIRGLFLDNLHHCSREMLSYIATASHYCGFAPLSIAVAVPQLCFWG